MKRQLLRSPIFGNPEVLSKVNFRIDEVIGSMKMTDSVIPSSSSKSTFEFHIAGVPYRLKTHHDAQTVDQLVGLVHQKMEAALKATRSGSYQNAAILTALQLAEEMLNLKLSAKDQIAEIESQLSELKTKLEGLEQKEESQPASEEKTLFAGTEEILEESPEQPAELYHP